MKKRNTVFFVGAIPIIAVVILVSFLIAFPSERNSYITDDLKIDVSNVKSYTVSNTGASNKRIFTANDNKFKKISKILSSKKVKRDENNLYLYDEKHSTALTLRGKNGKVSFYAYKAESKQGEVTLILSDPYKKLGTVFWLDFHNCYVTSLTQEEYDFIFG